MSRRTDGPRTFLDFAVKAQAEIIATLQARLSELDARLAQVEMKR